MATMRLWLIAIVASIPAVILASHSRYVAVDILSLLQLTDDYENLAEKASAFYVEGAKWYPEGPERERRRHAMVKTLMFVQEHMYVLLGRERALRWAGAVQFLSLRPDDPQHAELPRLTEYGKLTLLALELAEDSRGVLEMLGVQAEIAESLADAVARARQTPECPVARIVGCVLTALELWPPGASLSALLQVDSASPVFLQPAMRDVDWVAMYGAVSLEEIWLEMFYIRALMAVETESAQFDWERLQWHTAVQLEELEYPRHDAASDAEVALRRQKVMLRDALYAAAKGVHRTTIREMRRAVSDMRVARLAGRFGALWQTDAPVVAPGEPYCGTLFETTLPSFRAAMEAIHPVSFSTEQFGFALTKFCTYMDYHLLREVPLGVTPVRASLPVRLRRMSVADHFAHSAAQVALQMHTHPFVAYIVLIAAYEDYWQPLFRTRVGHYVLVRELLQDTEMSEMGGVAGRMMRTAMDLLSRRSGLDFAAVFEYVFAKGIVSGNVFHRGECAGAWWPVHGAGEQLLAVALRLSPRAPTRTLLTALALLYTAHGVGLRGMGIADRADNVARAVGAFALVLRLAPDLDSREDALAFLVGFAQLTLYDVSYVVLVAAAATAWAEQRRAQAQCASAEAEFVASAELVELEGVGGFGGIAIASPDHVSNLDVDETRADREGQARRSFRRRVMDIPESFRRLTRTLSDRIVSSIGRPWPAQTIATAEETFDVVGALAEASVVTPSHQGLGTEGAAAMAIPQARVVRSFAYLFLDATLSQAPLLTLSDARAWLLGLSLDENAVRVLLARLAHMDAPLHRDAVIDAVVAYMEAVGRPVCRGEDVASLLLLVDHYGLP